MAGQGKLTIAASVEEIRCEGRRCDGCRIAVLNALKNKGHGLSGCQGCGPKWPEWILKAESHMAVLSPPKYDAVASVAVWPKMA